MKTDNSVQSIFRAASILKVFSLHEFELGVAQIGQKTAIPKTSARRIAETLTMTGLLERSATKGRYKIGPALYVQGNLYLQTSQILTEVQLVTSTLNDLTGETITASIFNQDEGYVTYVIVEDSIHRIIWNIGVGATRLAYVSAMGKAFLSELTDDKVKSLYPSEMLQEKLKKAPKVPEGAIATRTELMTELAQIRETGLAFGCLEDMWGVSTLVRNTSGKAVVGINITVPMVRVNEAKRERYALLLKLGASLASYRLGYYDSSNPMHSIEELRTWWQQNQRIPVTQAEDSTQTD